jgi:regulator of protease activity HflC (stomatin/prohibitin superfamily)
LRSLQSAVGSKEANECFAHKDAISTAIRESTTERLSALGFELDDVPITQVDPHESVAAALLKVQEAKMFSDAAEERARGTKVQIVTEESILGHPTG